MILFANDLAGNRVYIENAVPGTAYICEECQTRLIAKNQGEIVSHHYAHEPDERYRLVQRECSERNDLRTANQMSEWHKYWQSRYPEQKREVVFKHFEKTFRADIFLSESKTVIEFQHSKIDSELFRKRNDFYNSIGLKVIWVFDFDALDGKYKYIYPDRYDEFIKRFIRPKQSVYRMDKNTYLSIFGKWKPRDNKRVNIYFMCSNKNITFYHHIQSATGSYDNGLPMNLFVDPVSYNEFLSVVGLK